MENSFGTLELKQILNNKVIILHRKEKFGITLTTKEETQHKEIIIPPLNTDIKFASFNKKNLKELFKNDQNEIILPKQFSWAITTENDSDLIKSKKKIIEKPFTQYACGCCYAVAIAQSMSDCFVVSGTTSWNPKISPTYLMSSTKSSNNQMCGGGSIFRLVKLLEKQPIAADSSCIDYSWCVNNKNCTSVDSTKHFDASALVELLNSQIPDSEKCYFSGQKLLYKLDPNSEVAGIDSNTSEDVFRKLVKTHILNFGPVIGGFMVFENFINGNFSNPSFNGGVYLDRANYSNGKILTFSDEMSSQNHLKGLHAVSIVGWGVAKNIQYDTDKIGDVPFWHCRNSWGNKWGDKGYFKIAMFPFNKISQFDKQIKIKDGSIGSMILFKATTNPKIETLKQIEPKYFNSIKRQFNDSFYQATPEIIPQLFGNNLEKNEIDIYFKWICFICLIIIFILLITKLLKIIFKY